MAQSVKLLKEIQSFVLACREDFSKNIPGSFIKWKSFRFPQIICGDFDSVPSSSAMATFNYSKQKDIFGEQGAIWSIPSECPPEMSVRYSEIWQALKEQ